jgi:serine/threonine protein kinase
MEQYKIKEPPIGWGRYGIVYEAYDIKSGKKVAIKKLKPSDSVGVHFTSIREIGTLQELDHENVIKILNVVCLKKDIFIVYELLPSDLKKLIDNRNVVLTQAIIKTYTYMILGAVKHCHENCVLHRVFFFFFLRLF